MRLLRRFRSSFELIAAPALTLVLAACGPAPANLVPDARLSNTFSDQLGVVAHDLGLIEFSLRCDGTTKKLNAHLEYVMPSGSVKEVLDSDTRCTHEGLALAAYEENNSASYRVAARSAYDAELVLAEWRKTIAPRFGTFAHDEKMSAEVTAAYGDALDDKKALMVGMTCNPQTHLLRYQVVFVVEDRPGRFPENALTEGETTLACPNVAEKSPVLFRVGPAPSSPSPVKKDGARYRVVTTKAVDAGLASLFMAEVVKATGRQSSF